MIVSCSQCRRRYRLPERLLGPRGARVRCPGCRAAFEVAAPPAIAVPAVGGSGAAPRSGGSTDPAAIAEAVVERLAPHAAALEAARAGGRPLSETGELLLGALEEYRRRAGPEASGRVFREALRRRWRIDLGPR